MDRQKEITLTVFNIFPYAYLVNMASHKAKLESAVTTSPKKRKKKKKSELLVHAKFIDEVKLKANNS